MRALDVCRCIISYALVVLELVVPVSSFLYGSPLRSSVAAHHGRQEHYAFRRRDGDDDGDDDDEEPPDFSTTPEEFRLKLESKTSTTAFGPGRGRSSPMIRPAFGAKKDNNKNMATVYVCTNCGAEYVQWQGKCGTW